MGVCRGFEEPPERQMLRLFSCRLRPSESLNPKPKRLGLRFLLGVVSLRSPPAIPSGTSVRPRGRRLTIFAHIALYACEELCGNPSLRLVFRLDLYTHLWARSIHALWLAAFVWIYLGLQPRYPAGGPRSLPGTARPGGCAPAPGLFYVPTWTACSNPGGRYRQPLPC